MALFLFLISLSLAIFHDSQADLLGDICSRSVNPTLCNSSLRSDPRSSGADLRTLAQIAIEKASAATATTIKVANSLASSGTSQQKIAACVQNCNEAIGVLDQCREILTGGGGGSSGNLPTKATTALTDISICDSEFGREEPPQLKEASSQAQALVNVFFVIANRL
ncbi:hypothetical protein C2S51_019521 [Perilla frutescens var. frutescens]|nr:hypothetical protein C2S51_019521 [Perilla frutescens var. frutescens]